MQTRESATKRVRKSYAKLVGQLMPRPLHDEVDYRNALAVLDAMAGFDLNADQHDYVDAIATFVEKYEAERHAIEHNASPAELLRALMAEHGLGASDLGRLLGDRAPWASHPERRTDAEQDAHPRPGRAFLPRSGRVAVAGDRECLCRLEVPGDTGRV